MNANTDTFKLINTEKVESLNIEYQEYQHTRTSAKHIHLASNNNENVFLVALRTIPTDSTGVAHILEHTSLCGSEKYPVRDPFFMMIRRSLNTFMNAFTSSDWTAYPFASQNKKDFNNLLSVYLDAVFFARLDPLDFAQEGHRLEFEEPENPNSPLLYKGVVFNEMKGAMSSISSQLWQAIGEELFPNTTYGFNSGGEPANIPDLSYEQLQSFYRTHYHPDNAIFITYGDISAREHQLKFEQLALQSFAPLDTHIEVPLEQPFESPNRCTKYYPLADGEKADRNTHQVIGWVIGDIRDPLELMTAHLLSSVLLENSASPLQQVLETSELGSSPSPLCGVDDSGLQMIFVCGLQGCDINSTEVFEQEILDTLEKVASDGVKEERLVALLDQLELQQREISGDSYPYGLQIMLSCLATAMHRGNSVNALNIDPILKTLRESIKDPDFIPSVVRRMLLNNPHRTTLTMLPDSDLNRKTLQGETDKLAVIKKQLNEQNIAEIIKTSQALKQRQLAEDDPELLPKVDLSDVPEHIEIPEYETQKIAERNVTLYPQGTNGLVYRQIVSPLPNLNPEQHTLLSLHNRIITEVGIENKDYLQVQNWQSNVCGGINAFSSLKGTRDNEQNVTGFFTLSAKGLSSRSQDIEELLYSSYFNPRFDEHQRISELISQSATRAEQSVTGNGHSLAMAIACQGMSPSAKLAHTTSGVLGIKNLKALDQTLKSEDARYNLSDQLNQLHIQLINNGQQFLTVSEASLFGTTNQVISDLWLTAPSSSQHSQLQLPENRQKIRELWVCNSQVNFCAKAYQTVTAEHTDAAALTVLAGVLRNGFLHTAIREQGGAYGGGASHDSQNATFRFYSYRDPRLTDTLNDFDRSITWLLETEHPYRTVEESILQVISSLDKPSSPAGTAKQHFHNTLFGRTPEHHKAFRQAVLSVTSNDLKRVAESYLLPEQASIGVVSHAGEEKQYKTLCEANDIKILTL